MGKPILTDVRSDLSGGRNTKVSPERLNPNEVVDCTNFRVSTVYGGLTKRNGVEAFVTTGTGQPITGLFQWNAPSGDGQVVALSNGTLYAWTRTAFEAGSAASHSITPGTHFSTSTRQTFAGFRAASSGAPLNLFIADGNLYTYDGNTTVTKLTGTNSAPAADLISAYHTRIFARDTNFKNTLFWSIIGDGTDFRTGTSAQGGSALVDVITGNTLTAMSTVGSSLILATNESLMRFTGYSNQDIQVAQDTEGISADVGAAGPNAICRAEALGYVFSSRGLYVFSEGAIDQVSVNITPDLDVLDQSKLSSACLAYHRGRQEVWLATLDTNGHTKIWVYHTKLKSWSGPFVFNDTTNLNFTVITKYVDSAGDEWLIGGTDKGVICHLDVASTRDITITPTNVGILGQVDLPPIVFGTPGETKRLKRGFLQADIPGRVDNTAAVKVFTRFDTAAFSGTPAASLVGDDTGEPENYRMDLSGQGKRLWIRLKDDNTSDAGQQNGETTIYGLVTEAWRYGRP